MPSMLAQRSGFDACFLGFLAQPLFPISWVRRDRPVIFDAFLSVYDTICLDRKAFSPGSPIGRAAHWLDSRSLRWASRVTTDTELDADFMSAEFRIPRDKFVAIPVGADESMFYPSQGAHDGAVNVLYYSSFLPLHGVPVVVEAAGMLRDRRNIGFTIIGRGPESERVMKLANERGLDNCRFVDWVPLAQLPTYIANCAIFLGGHFNPDNEKAHRVVPGKAFQGLAMARPVVLGDYAANRQWFRHGENAWMVPPGDARSLARAIEELAASEALRGRLGVAGYQLFRADFSEEAISRRLDECVAAVLGR
jgi:glycosyltransferase involved in cell wall biosynthesis